MSILYFPGEKNRSVIELPGQRSVLTSWWGCLPAWWTGMRRKQGHFSLLRTRPARAMLPALLLTQDTSQTRQGSSKQPTAFTSTAFVTHPNVPTTPLFFCDGAQLSLQARRCQSRGHYTRGIWTNPRPLVFSESRHIVLLLHHQLSELCLTFWTLP